MNRSQIILSALLCTITSLCCAQGQIPFEGKMTYSSIVVCNGLGNPGDKAFVYKGYYSYNGKHDKMVVFRNYDKHEYDLKLHTHYIYLVSQNRYIFYSDETKTGIECPLNRIFEIGASNEALGIEKTSTITKTDRKGNVFGTPCDIYEGSIITTDNGQKNTSDLVREIWISTQFGADSIFNGCNIFKPTGLIMKDITTHKDKIKLVVTMKSNYYVSEIITDMEQRKVADSEFEVPSDVSIEKFRTVYAAQEPIRKISLATFKSLKKKGEDPREAPDNETFELDQEWE